MGIMADRLNNMHVQVSSPDGQIQGVYRNRDDLSLSFTGSSFKHYQERTLEFQLSRLALLLWTGYQRVYDNAVSEVVGHPVKDERHTWDANRRRFREEQAKTVVQGMSDGKQVYLENTGMRNWHVVIKDGTVQTLDEEQFNTECVSAFYALMADHRMKMAALRNKHYGVPFAVTTPSTRTEQGVPS